VQHFIRNDRIVKGFGSLFPKILVYNVGAKGFLKWQEEAQPFLITAVYWYCCSACILARR